MSKKSKKKYTNYWKSYLIEFRDDKIQFLGELYGDYCTEEDQRKVIVTKMTNNEKRIFYEFCKEDLIKEYQDKFKFIEGYWNEESFRFVR